MKKTILLTLLSAGALVATASAQTIVSAYDIDNGGNVRDRGSNDTNIGWAGADSYSAALIWELADLGTVAGYSSDLSVQVDKVKTPPNPGGVSLYVALITDTADATIANSYAAPGGAAPTGYTFIQDDLFTNTATAGTAYSLSATGKSNLNAFLDANYPTSAAFTGGSQYLIASLQSKDGSTTDPGAFWEAWQIDQDGNSFTVTAIPEPSSFALMAGALALAGVMLRRRRA